MTFVPSSSLFSDLSLHTVLEDESLIAAVADIKAHFFSHLAFHFHVGEKGQSDAERGDSFHRLMELLI